MSGLCFAKSRSNAQCNAIYFSIINFDQSRIRGESGCNKSCMIFTNKYHPLRFTTLTTKK